MQSTAETPEKYCSEIPQERQEAFNRLRKVIKDNLPEGFTESMSYGMIGFGVPHSLYPSGYHCNPSLPLPFIALASQKNFIAFYHMGIYGDPELLKWFTDAYSQNYTTKLDMGKSCLRFKKMDQIPFDLIAELVSKITVEQWISMYENNMQR